MGFKTQHQSATLADTIVQKALADGAPTDADFDQPQDGLVVIAHNGTRWCLYGRAAGSWVNLSPAT